MKKLIKQQWLAALRSGDYEQNKGRLRVGNKFCALGVLVDLHSKASYSKWEESEAGWRYLDADGSNEDYFLTPAVQKWAKLTGPGPKLTYNEVVGVSLVNLNDGDVYDPKYKGEVPGLSFSELANLIEEQL